MIRRTFLAILSSIPILGSLNLEADDKVYTVKNGNFSDPSTWSSGRVPKGKETIVIKHIINVEGMDRLR